MISDGTRVLIVPDGILGGATRGTPLRADAIDLRPVDSGEAALALAPEFRPALVIFENPLPDMGAAEFCVRMREAVGEGPQLLMISREGRDPGDEGLAAEVDAHLLCPLDRAEMLDALMLLLEHGADRGRCVRLELLVRLRGFHEGAPGGDVATALELTERTLRVEASEPLALDASGEVRLVLPGESAAITLRAWVLLRLDQPRMHYLLAIEPDDDARVRIARCLTSRRAPAEILPSEGAP